VGLRDLLANFPQDGRLETIIVRPGRGMPAVAVDETTAIVGLGLLGDRGSLAKLPNPSRKRQVTLIQREHLAVVAAVLGRSSVDATMLRRNLVVSGLNLMALRSPLRDLRMGVEILDPRSGEGALLEVSGPCEPCSAMEAALGSGGYNAMRGHGGVTARVLRDGPVKVGMTVRVKLLAPHEPPSPAPSADTPAR
jgi:MOSC domain-containing protein YiiM